MTKQQARQLTTAMPKSKNVCIYSSDRNLEAQIIKNICSDDMFVKEYGICSMNSINFVRIASQICYYFWIYLQFIKSKKWNISSTDTVNTHYIDIAVPSGAFGNSCSAAFAKAMGLPIRHIIPCANSNDIVHRTLQHGDFSSILKDYRITKAPAMDIQIPYNLERFYWLCFHGDTDLIKSIMSEFEGYHGDSNDFKYQFSDRMRAEFRRFIERSYCVNDEVIGEFIPFLLRTYQHVTGPHGCCSIYGAMKTKEEINDDVPMIAVLTAHPAKFPEIIRGFTGRGDNAIEQRELNKALSHRFLPGDDEKEECIRLNSNGVDDWIKVWSQRIKGDIIRMNSSTMLSKL